MEMYRGRIDVLSDLDTTAFLADEMNEPLGFTSVLGAPPLL